MGIRSQIVDFNSGITINCTDGKSYNVTRAQIQAIYQAASGGGATKLRNAIATLEAQILAALGIENIDPDRLLVDFDTQGRPTYCGMVGSKEERDALRLVPPGSR